MCGGVGGGAVADPGNSKWGCHSKTRGNPILDLRRTAANSQLASLKIDLEHSLCLTYSYNQTKIATTCKTNKYIVTNSS